MVIIEAIRKLRQRVIFPSDLDNEVLGSRSTAEALPLVPYYSQDVIIQIRIDFHVVTTQSRISEVVVLVQIIVPTTGQLQYLRADGLVGGRHEEHSGVVLHVGHGDLEEGADFEGTEGEHLSGEVTVYVELLLLGSVASGPSKAYFLVAAVAVEEVGVEHVQVLPGVDGVEDFQHIHAQQLIVAVDQSQDVFGVAELGGSSVDVGECRPSFLVLDDVDWLGDGVFLNEGLGELEGVVIRGIINDYYFEVGVVLVVERLDVVLVSEVLPVVASWHDQAEWLLWQAKVMLFGKALILLLQQLLDLPLDVYVLVDEFVVVEDELERNVGGLPAFEGRRLHHLLNVLSPLQVVLLPGAVVDVVCHYLRLGYRARPILVEHHQTPVVQFFPQQGLLLLQFLFLLIKSNQCLLQIQNTDLQVSYQQAQNQQNCQYHNQQPFGGI